MNAKIIAAAAMAAFVVAAVYIYATPQVTTGIASSAETAGTGTGTIATGNEASQASVIISDEYYALIQEEMDNLSTETDFGSQMQDDIANDMSQFYYP